MNCFFDIFRCVSKRRSASLTNLIDLPQLVLEQILENLDFHSILILRKVCHDLRDFIDYIKPSSHLECISIKVESKSIYLDLLFPSGFKSFNGSQFLDIEFHENENGCLSKCKTRRLEKKFLIGQDFVKTAMNYLKVLMKHQKSTLEFFRLEIDYYPNLPREFDRNLEPIAEEVLEGFREILESRRSQIQVEDFQMTVIRQDQVAQILPFVDSKVLQNIEIRGERDNPVASFEIDKLETHAKELKIWMFDVLTPLEKFSRFQKVEVLIQNVTVESILELKEVFKNSPTTEYIEITFTSIDHQLLIKSLGPPTIERQNSLIANHQWLYRLPVSQKCLTISYKYRSITFKVVNGSEIPQKFPRLEL